MCALFVVANTFRSVVRTAFAQVKSESAFTELMAVLPEKIESYNFTVSREPSGSHLPETYPATAICGLQIKKRVEDYEVQIDVQSLIIKDVSKRAYATTWFFPMDNSSNDYPRRSYSGRGIGQSCWNNGDGSLIVAYDGKACVASRISMLRRFATNNTENFQRKPRYEDIVLAENLLISTLDRMTAMGLTSKSVERASPEAKRQVELRLRELRQRAATKQ